jgi:hypothetical protein
LRINSPSSTPRSADIWMHSHVSFAQSDEVGEDGVGVGSDVVGLQPVGVQDLQEEV